MLIELERQVRNIEIRVVLIAESLEFLIVRDLGSLVIRKWQSRKSLHEPTWLHSPNGRKPGCSSHHL